MGVPGGRRDADEDEEVLEDEEWKDAEDRDPFRDQKIAKKQAERAYRQAARHNSKQGKP